MNIIYIIKIKIKIYFFLNFILIIYIAFYVTAASVNEDLRQLKDFKALISEKTVPKSIKILKRTVWVLVMILIILTGFKTNIFLLKK